MKKTLFFAFALVLLASCSNEDDYNYGVNRAEGINFCLYQDNGGETRTEYSTADWLQIDWTVGDKIDILCDNTLAAASGNTLRKKATYKVTGYVQNSGGTNVKHQARITTDDGNPLYWNDKDGAKHDFYATYGEDIQAQVYESGEKAGQYNGKFKCWYDNMQSLSLVNGSWVNMKQAYMIARRLNCYPTANVDLHFKCIMTVLEIEIKGMTDAPMNLSSVWITVPAGTQKVILDNNECFEYDYDNGPTNVGTTTTDETYQFVWDDAGQAAIPAGGSIKVIAILPPMNITANTLKIDVKSAGWNSKSVKINKSVAAGKKARFATANWTFDKTEPIDMGDGIKWSPVNILVTKADQTSTDNLANKPTDLGTHLIWSYHSGKAVNHYSSVTIGTNGYYMNLTNPTWSSSFTAGYDDKTNDCPSLSPNNASTYVSGDNLTTDYDHAYKLCGTAWRMPTDAQMATLRNTSTKTHKWVTMNDGVRDVKGLLIISKANGNCLFLGAWGKFGSPDNNKEKNFGAGCYYWTSTRHSSNKNSLCGYFGTDTYKADNYYRSIGMQVRPIKP